MAELRQYQLVRVAKLMEAPETYDGWKLNKRPPAVGDVGTLLDVLQAPGLPNRYVVECCKAGGDGSSEWLGDFLADELETVESK